MVIAVAQVIVENTSQPTLENLNDALGKAYGLPASRVWAIKNNWLKHEWVRLTPEMGLKKVGHDEQRTTGVLCLMSYSKICTATIVMRHVYDLWFFPIGSYSSDRM